MDVRASSGALLRGVGAAVRSFFSFSPVVFDRDSRLPNGGWPTGPAWGRGAWHSVPAAYAAVSVLSQTMAALPLRVVDVTGEGAPVPVGDSPVGALLEDPSSVLDSWQFWENFWRSVFTTGNGYAWIRRRGGRPVELIPCRLESSRWVESRDRRQVVRRLVPWDGLASFDAPDSDVIAVHWAEVNLQTMESASPISIAASTLGVMGKAAAHNESTLEQGLHARGFIKTTDIPAAKWDELVAELKETWSGTLNAGKTPVLQPGVEWMPMGGFSAVDLQLLQFLRFGVEEISRIFGVPPRLLHQFSEGKKVESSKYMHLAADFERHTIAPHSRRAGAQFTRKLLPGQAGLRVVLDTRLVREGSLDELAEVVNKLVARTGVWTIREGRAALGYGPIEGDDVLLQPTGAPPQRGGGE